MSEIQNILKNQLNNINKLVLSGGGAKGCIFVGMLKYLEEINRREQIKTIAGTSIGALMATLITLGFTAAELEQIMKQFDYKKYQAIDVNCLFEKFGIDTFENMYKFIESLFIKKKFSPEITFKALYEKTQIHLIFNSVCLNIRQTTFFDYLKTPDMPIILALEASMALPYMFASVVYKGLTYLDGGILNNFPIDYELFQKNPESVLGINLHNPLNYSIKEIKTIDNFSLQLFSCLYNAYIEIVEKNYVDPHIINISAQKFSTFDLDLTMEDKQFLFDSGYHKTKEYFEVTLINKIVKQIEQKKLELEEREKKLLEEQKIKNSLEKQKQLLDEANRQSIIFLQTIDQYLDKTQIKDAQSLIKKQIESLSSQSHIDNK